MKIVDAHNHIGEWGTWEYRKYRISPFEGFEIKDVEDYETFLQKNNIAKSIVCPTYCPDGNIAFRYNRLVEEAVKQLDGVYGALWINPIPEFKEKSEEVLNNIKKGIIALKMSPNAWKQFTPDPNSWNRDVREIMEKAIESRLILQMHTGSQNSDIEHVEKLIDEYSPRIHLVHMGGTVRGHFKLIPRLKEWIETGLEVYADTSWARGFAVKWAVNYLDSVKNIFFASDNPWGDFKSELEKIKSLDISDDEKDMILYKNAERVYGI